MRRLSAALCVDWIRSKISLCDQGRDRERLKDLRLHLPMNIWCLFEARAGDPLSGRRGVGGNLPYLPPANFQQFLRWTCHCIPVELQSYVSILFILDNCQLLYFFLCAVSYRESASSSRYWAVVELRPDSTSKSLSTTRWRLSQRILISNGQSLANQVMGWPRCYFDILIAKQN